jgi:hypothetical protein
MRFNDGRSILVNKTMIIREGGSSSCRVNWPSVPLNTLNYDPPPSSTPELMPALRIPPRRLAPAAAAAGTPAAAPPTTAASGAPGCDGERGALLAAD